MYDGGFNPVRRAFVIVIFSLLQLKLQESVRDK
jgi:hypothetical protein